MKCLLSLLGVLAGLSGTAGSGFCQGTPFTYQGRLNIGNQPASGTYDLSFTLFNSNTAGTPIGSPITNAATALTNGLFSVGLNFGSVFDGTPRWLEIGVRTNGGSFTTLTPRQALTPTPYALFATTASNLAGTLPASQLTGPVNPAPGSPYYIQNQSAFPQSGSFNLSGSASIGGNLTVGTLTVPTPVNNSDAASKGYVDSTVAAAPVKAPSVSSLPPAAATNAGLMVFSTSSGNLLVCDGTTWNTVGPRRLFYTSGGAQAASSSTVGSTPTTVPNRQLSFTKANAASRLRISYSDNLGVTSASAAAVWEIRLDGMALSPVLAQSLYNGTSGTILQPGSLAGYATGVAAGNHLLSVYVYAAPGYANVGTSTGWNSSFLLEVEEIP